MKRSFKFPLDFAKPGVTPACISKRPLNLNVSSTFLRYPQRITPPPPLYLSLPFNVSWPQWSSLWMRGEYDDSHFFRSSLSLIKESAGNYTFLLFLHWRENQWRKKEVEQTKMLICLSLLKHQLWLLLR
jgi:hypothetical protein